MAGDLQGGGEASFGRYRVHEELGRGGMARVYRATDSASGREVALKQLVPPQNPAERTVVAALFEREFHLLAQLRHPRVISVYDYGLNGTGEPYYAMELLDGGDLRDRAPLPWREACALVFDVCSSLALLHSRRLIHRDVSPRNVRCTRDGRAKLIDFGAMSAMGASGVQVVGTPGFTSPETVHRSALDGRTDLFSLGATLYYAITGFLPYPARTFAEALAAWSEKPLPMAARVRDVPHALDDLVLSLLNVQPSLRPKSSFEVMQRLAAIAGLQTSEADGVSRAYLSTPTLIGRDAVIARLREELQLGLTGRGGGLILRGAPGQGRSRVLDECALEAKTFGATVLRASASGHEEAFGVALALLRHLVEALPDSSQGTAFEELFNPPQPTAAASLRSLKPTAELLADPEQFQQTLSRFILTVSRTHPLVVAVDDVERTDEPSAAVLTSLIDKARRGSVFVALTAPSQAGPASLALDVLARRCEELEVPPLSHEQNEALVTSLFGDVPNIAPIADGLFRLSHGNPRQCLDLAQHLIDSGVISYSAGVWTLPRELSETALPRSTEDAMRQRIAALPADARWLAEAQALDFHGQLSLSSYRALLPDRDADQVDAAVSALLAAQLLASVGAYWVLAHGTWRDLLLSSLDESRRRELHATLARSYAGQSTSALVHHLFAAGLDEQGLDALKQRHEQFDQHFDYKNVLETDVGRLGPAFERATAALVRLGRPAREVNDMRRWFVATSVMSEARYYYENAPIWLRQLEHDSGLALYRADHETAEPGPRLMKALQTAYERYQATPEHERVYPVDEAIRMLAEYVVFSIAIGGRTQDTELKGTLPALLEPFASLSPVLEAIWQNSIATLELGRDALYDQARARWIRVYEKLSSMTTAEATHVELICNAVASVIGLIDVYSGIAAATTWAARIEADPSQRLSAIALRRIVLYEQGDWSGAEKLRRQAEVHALRTRVRQMFHFTLTVEVSAHAYALDLAGLKHTIEQIEPIAAQYPGWRGCLLDAQARYQQLSGDLASARALFEQAIALCPIDADDVGPIRIVWINARTGLAEILLAQDRAAESKAIAAETLALCERQAIEAASVDVVRQLALAEAKLGEHTSAAARVDRLITAQIALGVSGLRLGLSYEARARVAMAADDQAGFDENARAAAREYRYAQRSPLGARYERLITEASRSGFHSLPELSPADAQTQDGAQFQSVSTVYSVVMSAMLTAHDTDERARNALRISCIARGARDGHLYLLRGQDVTLSASLGGTAAPDELRLLIGDFITRERERSETLTVVATGGLDVAASELQTNVRIGSLSYDLMLLSCVIGNTGHIAGVIAVATADSRPRVQQSQLLASLAAHFVQAGDCAPAND